MQRDKSYSPTAIAEWFDDRATDYDEVYYAQRSDMHCADQYRAKHVIDLVERIRPSRILDIGCGTGIVSFQLIERGYEVAGFDLSPGMIHEAREKSKSVGYDPKLFEVADIYDQEMVSRYRSLDFDLVIANGVFPYIDAPDLAHDNISKILPTGGHYIGSYANRLFDIFTLNRFTVDFHVELAESIGFKPNALDSIRHAVESLLTRPKEPEHIELSASNQLYSRADNPLTIKDELCNHKMELLDLRFYKFHALAPLVAKEYPELKDKFLTLSQKMEEELCTDWRGYFLTTSFICCAKKM